MKKIVEKINPTDRTTSSIMLINAMTHECKHSDILEYFRIERVNGLDTTVDVELIINGVHVDVKKSLDEMFKRLVSRYDDKVLEKAKELLSESRLNRLSRLIQNAEYNIEQELNQLFKEE